jgi:hypothetical protein
MGFDVVRKIALAMPDVEEGTIRGSGLWLLASCGRPAGQGPSN